MTKSKYQNKFEIQISKQNSFVISRNQYFWILGFGFILTFEFYHLNFTYIPLYNTPDKQQHTSYNQGIRRHL